MLWIFADDAYDPLTKDNRTLVAHFFDGRSYFHKDEKKSLFFTKFYSSFGEIIWRKLNKNRISRNKRNTVFTHLSRHITFNNDTPISKIGNLGLKFTTRKGLKDNAGDFDDSIITHKEMEKVVSKKCHGIV